MASSVSLLNQITPLQNTSKDATVVEPKQEIIEMVDIPDLPLDELEQAMAEEQKDLTVQDVSGGSVVFGIIGSGQAGRKNCRVFL